MGAVWERLSVGYFPEPDTKLIPLVPNFERKERASTRPERSSETSLAHKQLTPYTRGTLSGTDHG